MIAALGTSSPASGIWLYAQTESIVEKNFYCRLSMQNIECDIGYHYSLHIYTNNKFYGTCITILIGAFKIYKYIYTYLFMFIHRLD